jgi:hypothetical protein
MDGGFEKNRYAAKESAAKYERIVKEASRAFRERGFENVTVGEVMKAARLNDSRLRPQASLPAYFFAGRIGVTPTCSSAVYGAP